LIAWIDLETTGLDTECSIIEVACVVTDEKFNEVASYESLVVPEFTAYWEPGAREMHRASGLEALVYGSNKFIMTVDRELAEVLGNLPAVLTDNPLKPYILGGQSVHFDRGFVERWMPLTNTYLSHRQIDVSGLKLMWGYALGIPTEALPPEKSKTTHRAMDDIRASIEAAKWYRNYIGEAQFVNDGIV